MSTKVKRGLGLLVVALLAALLYLALREPDGSGVSMGVAETARLAALWCGLIGLVLVAWGLLRD